MVRAAVSLTVDVTVANTVGSRSSSSETVPIPAAPSITTQPVDQEIYLGDEATFTVVAAGGELSYQWQTDGPGDWVDIPGATASSFVTTPTEPSQDWQYRCVVSNQYGSVISNPALASLSVLFTWTGSSDAETWEDVGNWSTNSLSYPKALNHEAVISSTSHDIVLVDLNIELKSLDLIGSFSGKLTIAHEQPDLIAPYLGDVNHEVGTLAKVPGYRWVRANNFISHSNLQNLHLLVAGDIFIYSTASTLGARIEVGGSGPIDHIVSLQIPPYQLQDLLLYDGSVFTLPHGIVVNALTIDQVEEVRFAEGEVTSGLSMDILGITSTKTKLRSTVDGQHWKINTDEYFSISNVDIKDSDASEASEPAVATDSIDSGNNLGWTFQ